MTARIALLGLDEAVVDTGDGAAHIFGERLLGPESADDEFILSDDARWHWGDGRPLTATERRRIAELALATGTEAGVRFRVSDWERFGRDAMSQVPGGTGTVAPRLEFMGADMMKLSTESGSVFIEGWLDHSAGRRQFRVPVTAAWKDSGGRALSRSKARRAFDLAFDLALALGIELRFEE
jgi:hypothetical protein